MLLKAEGRSEALAMAEKDRSLPANRPPKWGNTRFRNMPQKLFRAFVARYAPITGTRESGFYLRSGAGLLGHRYEAKLGIYRLSDHLGAFCV